MVAGSPYCVGGWLGEGCGGAAVQTGAELIEGGAGGDLADFSEEVIGEGHAGEGGAGFEFAVNGVWDVADLDHGGHVVRMGACGAHVKAARC